LKRLAVCTLALVAAGCASGYNAGVTRVSGSHMFFEWTSWGAAQELPETAEAGRIALLRKEVEHWRAQPVSVHIYRIRTGETAPAIVVASFTPRSWLLKRSRGLLAAIDRDVGSGGPFYLGLVDVRGHFVWEVGRSMTATGPVGGVWSPRELDACQPIQHSEPAAAPPPPPCYPD
jgi:hypothetical protein